MSRTNHIAAFVDDLLSMKTDLVLQALPQTEKSAGSIRMAADTAKTMTLSASRVGSLADTESQMLVRVYKDEAEQCYHLYLLSATPQTPAYALLSMSGDSRFFVANADGQIEIPFLENIDPLETIFQLSFPKQSVELNHIPNTDIVITIDVFRVQFDPLNSQLHIELILQNDTNAPVPTKLVYHSGQLDKSTIRLIPIRDLLASIHLDETFDHSLGITLCTYA